MILEVEIPCKSVYSPGTMYVRSRALVEKILYLQVFMDDKEPEWRTKLTFIRRPIHIPCTKEATLFLFKHILHYPTLEEIDYDVTENDYKEAQALPVQKLRDLWAVALFFECDDFKYLMWHLMMMKLDKMPDAEVDEFLATPSGQIVERANLARFRARQEERKRERMNRRRRIDNS